VVVICTGRNSRSLDSLLDRSGWHPDDLPKVTLNGAVVDGGRGHGLLAHHALERPLVTRLVDLFVASGAVPMVYATEEDDGHLHYLDSPPNSILAQYIAHRRHRVGALTAHADLAVAIPDHALEVGTIDRREVIEPLTAAVRAELDGRVRVINTRSLLGEGQYFWAEVYHHACSKGTGALLVASALGVDPGRIVAIGDNFNDLDMFDVAALSVAVAGGPQEVQDAADHVAGPVQESGVAAVLERLAAGTFGPGIAPDLPPPDSPPDSPPHEETA
jgi:hydroxymethylpyrimidine pyrophosphatase-like HAD family hydrolase